MIAVLAKRLPIVNSPVCTAIARVRAEDSGAGPGTLRES
jgi:hypothetical protein